MMIARVALLVTALAALGWFLIRADQAPDEFTSWDERELRVLDSLQIRHLGQPPADPSNRYEDDPRAITLGHRLFYDQRFSANGRVACSNCHQPDRYFTDGLPVSVGIATVDRNAPSLVGAAYSPWYFWDGRKDSLWSQATAPLENPLEHGMHRSAILRLIDADDGYREDYVELFGPLPSLPSAGEWNAHSEVERDAVTRVLVNLSKALAAYQRLLRPGTSRFDAYVAEVIHSGTGNSSRILNVEERRGLKLFIGGAGCINCHNGPLFSNQAFHNTGSLSAPGQVPSRGRIRGLAALLLDPLNCFGLYSDDPVHTCVELRFVKQGADLLGAHRTPSLRNVSETAPYMHAGQLPTLAAVVDHYDRASDAMIGHNEAKPLDLSSGDRAGLVAFLRSLDGPIDVEPRYLKAPASD